jgi:hypothetical protein
MQEAATERETESKIALVRDLRGLHVSITLTPIQALQLNSPSETGTGGAPARYRLVAQLVRLREMRREGNIG